MKRTQFLIVLALVAASSLFWQCGDDPKPAVSPQDEQLTKLSQTWKSTSVTFNSGAPLTGYENFVLVMTGTAGNATFNYTATGRPSGQKTPWDNAGTFTFGSDFATVVTRNDNVVVTYSVTATQLLMTFTYAGDGFTGRTSNVEGEWTFVFGL